MRMPICTEIRASANLLTCPPAAHPPLPYHINAPGSTLGSYNLPVSNLWSGGAMPPHLMLESCARPVAGGSISRIVPCPPVHHRGTPPSSCWLPCNSHWPAVCSVLRVVCPACC